MQGSKPARVPQNDCPARLVDEQTYCTLHRKARSILRKERAETRMEPAELVSEAYLRLSRAHEALQIQNAKHFIALAILNMHRILIDQARSATSRANGHYVPLEPEIQAPSDLPAETLYMRPLLARLADVNQRQFAVVKMRFYWGLELEEIASILSVSTRTVRRDWNGARCWLRSQLTRQRPPHRTPAVHSSCPFTPGIAA